MTIQLPPWLGITVMLVVCCSAIWKGGTEERSVAVALLLNTGLTLLMRNWHRPFEVGGFVADILTFALMSVFALRSVKFWPMFAAAFQLLGILTHIAKIIDPSIQPWAYVTALVLWTYLIYVSLGVGTWNRWRGTRQLANADAAAGATRR